MLKRVILSITALVFLSIYFNMLILNRTHVAKHAVQSKGQTQYYPTPRVYHTQHLDGGNAMHINAIRAGDNQQHRQKTHTSTIYAQTHNPALPTAKNNSGFGVVLVDIRKPSQNISARILALLQQILATQSKLPCELWISPQSNKSDALEYLLRKHRQLITVRHMPAKFISDDGEYSIDLHSEHGGYIGKALALRDSQFLFPILFDSDSWPCHTWYDVVLNASKDVDIIWSMAPFPFGGAINHDPLACTMHSTADQISEYRKFPERNTGTVFAVRRNLATFAWLTDAIIIRAKMSHKAHKHKFPAFHDQAAFREALFLHRHGLREFIVPAHVACRPFSDVYSQCRTCLCECTSCIFVHTKSHFDQCAIFTRNRVEKTRFSNSTRFVFVAGLEGTGHHFLGNILQGSRDFRVSSADPIRCHLMRLDSAQGLFDLITDSDAYHHQEQKIAALFRNLDSNSTSFTLRVLNTHIDHSENCYTGMMSYPNGMSGTSWPDLRSLARVSEHAEIDLRIIVLTRRSIPMIQSISSRVRDVQKNAHLAEIGAMKLSEQLSGLDTSFYTCVSYDDLTTIARDVLQHLQGFLVPAQHAVGYDLISEVQKKLQYKNKTFKGLNPSVISAADDANRRLLAKCQMSAFS